MKATLLLALFVGQTALSQQRYLVSPNQEVIPISKSQVAAREIAKRLKRSEATNNADLVCTNRRILGYSEDKFPNTTTFDFYHKDVIGQWYVAPASGAIDTVFWATGAVVGAKDSLVSIRIH